MFPPMMKGFETVLNISSLALRYHRLVWLWPQQQQQIYKVVMNF